MTAKAHPQGGKGQAEIALLQAQCEALQAEVARWKDTAARAQADVQNAKMRVEKEASDMRSFASEQMLRRLLPALDNFQRAFQHVPEALREEEWVKGVAAIEQDLMRQVTDVGLKRMQSRGQHVDPHRHEILLTGPGSLDTVVDVLEEGYELHGKVLRPAKVKVGDGSVMN